MAPKAKIIADLEAALETKRAERHALYLDIVDRRTTLTRLEIQLVQLDKTIKEYADLVEAHAPRARKKGD